ncbi:hypothetical protein [Streptomyces alanosinicus]|uniref:Uncharacterized protein n=1 Tax=Streptomyces alanosinicus TaxID=68171 RepID=A0A918IPB1_9ACTN|nr:hypothetical protein [Streptomyces alanosinicus]GGW24175.1 hypothetical protein GCM10010339_93970 [Streptomyces alanosinicus]
MRARLHVEERRKGDGTDARIGLGPTRSAPAVGALRLGHADADDQPVQVDAYSAPQADRWVAVALHTISPALDCDASDEAWAWLSQGRTATHRALLRSEPCTVTVTVTVTQDHTRITWAIRPVTFLPLAHRQGVELPACTRDFKPCPTVSSLS